MVVESGGDDAKGSKEACMVKNSFSFNVQDIGDEACGRAGRHVLAFNSLIRLMGERQQAFDGENALTYDAIICGNKSVNGTCEMAADARTGSQQSRGGGADGTSLHLQVIHLARTSRGRVSPGSNNRIQ